MAKNTGNGSRIGSVNNRTQFLNKQICKAWYWYWTIYRSKIRWWTIQRYCQGNWRKTW